ncbi:MAG: hypothetical protein KBS97_01155 [Firmicutes bacterium]|nr:hypothetical protein [Candidatus Fiminaster equi]
MKKILPLLLLSATCLTACGEKSFAGVYKFQMGRQGQGEARIGLQITLKDDKYVVPESASQEEKEKLKDAKQFTLTIDIGSEMEEIFKAFDLDGGLNGYYIVMDEVDPKYGNKVALGIDIQVGEDFPIPVTSELIRNIVVTYADGQNVTLQLPVSLYDLQYQLCWYSGAYIDFDPKIKSKIHSLEDLAEYSLDVISTLKVCDLTEISPLPGKTGDARFGSHPEFITEEDGKDEEGKTKYKVIKDEISEMNDKYAGEFSNTFVYKMQSDGTRGDKIGSIYQALEGDKIYDVFYPLNGYEVPQDGLFDAIVVKENFLFGNLDLKAKFNVLTKNNDYSINWIHSNGAQDIYADGDKIKIKDIQVDPFEFRDFHDIKVQLKKD